MTIAIAQMQIKPACPMENVATMIEQINDAKEQNAQIIIFPELALSGLLVGDLWDNDTFCEECITAAQSIVELSSDITVIFGNVQRRQGRLYNSLCIAEKGKLNILEVPTGDSYIPGGYDKFTTIDKFDIYKLNIDSKQINVAFLLGNWQNKNIPYDVKNIDLVIELASRPMFVDDPVQSSSAFGCKMIRVNSYGMQNSGKTNYIMAGQSMYFDAKGKVCACADMLKSGLYMWDYNGGDIASSFAEGELLVQTLLAGTREFMSAIHAKKAVIGISGGIDSALAACIYATVLGPENVYLISMPSRYNSQQTQDLAKGMAQGLKTNFAVIPITDGFHGLLLQLEKSPLLNNSGEKLEYDINDSVKENIQARERGRILAAVAASLGAVFVCNSNKTECSIGYATFYGDLAGAFAAQADLWKYQVYAAAEFFQQMYPDAPLREIAAIKPSAELSEKQDVTKGLGDPLIYEYHDYLLRYWVENNSDLADIFAAYRQDKLEETIGCAKGMIADIFADSAAFVDDCERWWKLYRGMSIAKRLQAPPLLAVSRHPFGEPKQQAQDSCFISNRAKRLRSSLLNKHE